VTLQALSEALAAHGLKVHPATVGRFLARERKSFKKNRSTRRAHTISVTQAADNLDIVTLPPSDDDGLKQDVRGAMPRPDAAL
jgi:hypothetical protein